MRLSLVRGRGGALAKRGGLMSGTKVSGWENDFFSISVKCKVWQSLAKIEYQRKISDFYSLSYSSHKNCVIKTAAA
jgi:hypothetical protein